MKKVGIVICNYNKREYVVNCIQSVLESKTDDFDIFVVDNASTDDSVEAIKEAYGNQVTILVNEENLGGSGGFNTGIRKVLEKGYEYLYCLDNDVLVDENAVGALVDYLDGHPDTGVAGSIVYHMDYPGYVQQYGLDLDFENYTAITHYADVFDDGSIPEVNFCDTVATCSVMIRTRCIKETDIGIMPQDNFIYWDDMEWIYRFTLHGYKVVTIRDSVVLHKMGANVKPTNTFINYYMWRNRLNFFMRYTPKEQMEHMSYRLLSTVFDSLYESMYREEHHVMTSISYAFHDVLRGVRGKAAPHKILDNDANNDKIIQYLQGKKTCYIVPNGDEEQRQNVSEWLYQLQPELTFSEKEEHAEMIVELCDYVMYVKQGNHNRIYIDREHNSILDEADWQSVEQYEYSRALFIYMNQAAFLDAAQELRKVQKNVEEY